MKSLGRRHACNNHGVTLDDLDGAGAGRSDAAQQQQQLIPTLLITPPVLLLLPAHAPAQVFEYGSFAFAAGFLERGQIWRTHCGPSSTEITLF